MRKLALKTNITKHNLIPIVYIIWVTAT